MAVFIKKPPSLLLNTSKPDNSNSSKLDLLLIYDSSNWYKNRK